MAEKPLLLIDVDGVLNAHGGPYAGLPAPDGYTLYRRRDGSFTDPDGRLWAEGGLRVWLNPGHGPMLLALTGRVELAWCTAWREMANTQIGPLIGLPQLSVVPLPDGWQTLNDHIWKLPGVEAYAAGRALAWFDDEFTAADMEWAEKRTAEGTPTLLLRIDPVHGIRQQDVIAVAAWAAELPLKARIEELEDELAFVSARATEH